MCLSPSDCSSSFHELPMLNTAVDDDADISLTHFGHRGEFIRTLKSVLGQKLGAGEGGSDEETTDNQVNALGAIVGGVTDCADLSSTTTSHRLVCLIPP